MSTTEVDLKALSQTILGFGHLTRLRILMLLRGNTEPMSPNAMARTLGQPLETVSYHVRYLRTAELVTLHHTTPRRGAVEHFYTPTDEALRLLGIFIP